MGRREVGNKVGRKFVKARAYVTATTSLNGNIGQDKKHLAIHATFQNENQCKQTAAVSLKIQLYRYSALLSMEIDVCSSINAAFLKS